MHPKPLPLAEDAVAAATAANQPPADAVDEAAGRA